MGQKVTGGIEGTSDLGAIANILEETRVKGIECRTIMNVGCVNCGIIHGTMVKVGAFVMCNPCWEYNFNVPVIPLTGPLHDKYVKFLNKWKEQDQ